MPLLSIADSLRDDGCIVLEATSADEALVHLTVSQDVAVVFTDINLPGSMDGLRLAAAVRDGWPAVKVILTSGKKRSRLAAPEDLMFIEKPSAFHAITEAVRMVLD